ncbi:hypothetical protein AB0I28_13540 [Phytomonospora sp. NPDC050363]|uniref:hypothetical protein n=1 Tax=Phytomonospora sp. NPDC050363 TaxID=3155642 RepID=UPI0033E82628
MAMGFEVEIRRRITDNNQTVLIGDTELVQHPWFRLVSDKFNPGNGQYSNMEYVVGRFDQMAGTDQNAADLVTDRVRAMLMMNDELYAGEDLLANLVSNPQAGNQAINFYINATYGNTGNLRVRDCPANDDLRLYVHYTVGFEPSEWRTMLERIRPVVRPDSTQDRARTHLDDGLAVADHIVTNVVNGPINATGGQAAAVRTELRGHLALLYMHATVWIDRTLTLQRNGLQAANAAQARITNVVNQLPFEGGQPKNKIAALPRARLSQMYGLLSAQSRQILAANVDPVLDAFSTKVETRHGLDFPDNFQLNNAVAGTTSLAVYITSGLNGQNGISQQVLFGGMNETGVDNATHGHPRVPFEFRSLFAARVTWADLRLDALKVAGWSRDQNRVLT